jgi:hypothetical protein
MENELKYKIKVTLRDGSYYEYKTRYNWDVNEDKLNDTRKQFYGFDDDNFIAAREEILKVELKENETDDKKENA